MQQRRFEMGLPVARGRFGNQEKPPSCIVASSTAPPRSFGPSVPLGPVALRAPDGNIESCRQ